MVIEERVPLSSLTTLRVGGETRALARVESEADVRDALRYAKEHTLPFYVLGEGSNVLAPSVGFDGLIIRMETGGIAFAEKGGATILTAGAGVLWEDAVREAASAGLWGIENLAGIPGTCGATPVQNIGAYGADISQVLLHVDALDAVSGEVRRMSAEECAFGYRDSRFKHDPSLIILSVAFRLSRDGMVRADYGDMRAALEAGVDLSTPAAIGDAVRAIRAKKFPDLSTTGTAGSFFKNPVLTEEAYAALSERYGTVPRFPNPDGVKVPLAFILDKVLGLRGFRLGRAHLFGAQPLVLALDAGGTSEEAEALAREVEKRVYDATGITVEREVRTLENAHA